jgi:hypothetical protein
MLALTSRDTEVLFVLIHRVRLVSLQQISRTWWSGVKDSEHAARQRLTRPSPIVSSTKGNRAQNSKRSYDLVAPQEGGDVGSSHAGSASAVDSHSVYEDFAILRFCYVSGVAASRLLSAELSELLRRFLEEDKDAEE